MHLVKILTAESQTNKKIYILIENFYNLLKNQNWIKDYIFWELELFKILGYDLELSKLVSKNIIENKLQYIVKSSSEKKIIPNFLIDKNENLVDLITLHKGLKLIGDYLDKTILKPNNLNHHLCYEGLNFLI